MYSKMRTNMILTLFFFSGIYVGAEPPKLEIEQIVNAKGDYVSITPVTDAINVAYIGLSGIDPFPAEMLKDGRSFILPVRGLKDGDYKFVAVAIKQNEYTRKDFIVRVGNGSILPNPQPNPTPQPEPPKPDPKLDNAPVQTNGLHVLFIYESGQRISQNQFEILYGAKTAKYLNETCDRTNSQPNWRILDKDNPALPEFYRDALKRKRTSVPWVVVVVNKQYVYEGELKESVDDFIKLLDKYKPKSRTDHCPNCPEPYKFQSVPLTK